MSGAARQWYCPPPGYPPPARPSPTRRDAARSTRRARLRGRRRGRAARTPRRTSPRNPQRPHPERRRSASRTRFTLPTLAYRFPTAERTATRSASDHFIVPKAGETTAAVNTRPPSQTPASTTCATWKIIDQQYLPPNYYQFRDIICAFPAGLQPYHARPDSSGDWRARPEQFCPICWRALTRWSRAQRRTSLPFL